MIEFKEQDFGVFNENMAVLKRYPDLEKLHLDDENVTFPPVLSIQCVRELGYCMEVETEELQSR